MSSRICVKNLTKNTTEKDLKALFSTRGEITDVKIVKTAAGKSRQFGFIGFRTNEQAADCQNYFNNTFLKSARISVEMAMKIGDPALPSKHSSKPQSRQAAADKEQSKNTAPLSESTKNGPSSEVDGGKSEFMSVMKARGKTQFWANDDTPIQKIPLKGPVDYEPGKQQTKEDRNSSDSDSDSDSDEISSVGAGESSKTVPAAVSDLSYLKSKVSRLSEDSSDSEDEGHDNEEESHCESDSHGRRGQDSGARVPAQSPSPGETLDSPDDDSTDESRLFVRNLPFSCSEDELSALFEKFGPLTQVHIPLADTGDGRGKGFAFVQFMIPEHARNAKAELDGTSFQGRLLHVIMAKKSIEPQTDAADIAAAARARKMSSYQLKKEEERKKSAALKEGWNASYLRSDTVIEATADRYGVSRADIMDTAKVSGGELAVRLAISETQILQENKEYFQAHGVDISALESSTSANKTTKRSNTTILVKNLPYDLVDSELEDMFAKYGAISAFLVPKSKSVALVDFTEPVHARAALKGLAYRRYHHTPLYLEWAPLNVVSRGDKTDVKTTSKVSGAPNVNEKAVDNLENDTFSTLYVKNLSFGTSEEMIRDHLSRYGLVDGVRTISLPKRSHGDQKLAMGFGFIEFKTPQVGSMALQRLSGSVLDGRTLEIKPSDKRLSTPKLATANGDVECSKLLVRNVAFQATQKEIRELFAAFGSVKRVRIPKKMGGEHRGFAFVDFGSSKEAAAAKEALANTHLYGRHLVLEWASEEETSVEALRKRSQLDISAIRMGNQSKKQRTDGEDPFATDIGVGDML